MDVRIKELLKDKLNARNFEFNSKREVSQKGITLYSKRGDKITKCTNV